MYKNVVPQTPGVYLALFANDICLYATAVNAKHPLWIMLYCNILLHVTYLNITSYSLSQMQLVLKS
jgi:hypothetical protein